MADSTTTLRVDLVSESAGYDNTFGWYNSVTGQAGVLFADVGSGGTSATFTVKTADVANIQFFLIPDGDSDSRNTSAELGGPLKVTQLSDGTWALAVADANNNLVLSHGQPQVLYGTGANALFTETAKNAGGVDYASSTAGSNQTAATLAGDTADGATGQIAWEDQAAVKKNGVYSKPGDADYNDAVFNVSVLKPPPVANADSKTISEDAGATAINVLANDSDPNAGAVLHVASVKTTGLLGSVSISADGQSVVYTPSSSFQSLAQGETATETFSYTVADQFGGTSTATTTVTIAGANDAPIVASALTKAVAEGGSSTTLNLLQGASDVDHGAVLSVAGLSSLPAGFTLSGSTLTIDPSNSAYNALAQGESATITLNYNVVDEHGASVAQTATITIIGANDAPIVASAISAAGTEGSGTFALDLMQGASDVDHGAVLSISSLSSLPAGFTRSGNTITVDANNAVFNALAAGETSTAVVTYKIVDEHGASVNQTATFTVTGTNDAPIVASALTKAVTEGGSSTTLNLLQGASDVDHGAVLSVSGLSSLPAGFTLSGSTLTISPSNSAYNSLALGETATVTLNYNVVDEHGASVAQTATVTIAGANDAPIVASAISATGAEGSGTFALDLMQGASDVDHGAVLSISSLSSLPTGFARSGNTITVDTNNAAFNALAVGETSTAVLTYKIVDEHGASVNQTATFTITGTNDAPIVASALTKSGTEGSGTVSLNLLQGASDVDHGAVLSVSGISVNGLPAGQLPAGFTLSGSTLTVDTNSNAFLAMNAGQSVTSVINYNVVDEHGAAVAQTATVTVNGVNDDAPTTTLRVTFTSESASYDNTFGWYNNATGQAGVLFADVEQEGHNAPLTPGVSHADITVKSSDVGNIHYFLISDGADDSRNTSAELSGPLKVIQLSDGTWAVAIADSNGNVVTSHGSPQILYGTGANALFTETSKNAGGIDYASSTVGPSQTAATLAGDTANGPTGPLAWEDQAAVKNSHGVYGAPGDADYNDAVFNVSVLRATPVANNDAVSISADAGPTTVNVLANDSVVGDTLSVVSLFTPGVLGTVSIAPGGSGIVYTPAAAFADLSFGQTATETFNYAVIDHAGDSATATVTITIVGSDHAPVAIADTNAADPVVESGVNPGNTPFAGDPSATGNVLANDTDPDVVDSHTVTAVNGSAANVGATISGTYGTVKINADGSYTYLLDNSRPATDALAQGQTATEVFSYTNGDAHGASSSSTLTITITGTNDAPVAHADTAGGVVEDGNLTATGNALANDTDVDTGDTHTTFLVLPANPHGTKLHDVGSDYGTMHIEDNGNYTYTLDNSAAAVQALKQGEIVTDTFTYTNVDNNVATSSSTLTVTITGTNDGPVAVADTASATEAGGVHNATPGVNPTGNVLTNDTDADTGDTKTVTTIGTFTNAGNYGTLTLNADGSYCYVVNNGNAAVESLRTPSDTLTDTFSYTMRDTVGALSSATLTITIHGQNDAPVAVAITGAANEDGPATILSASYSDPDASDPHAFTVNTAGTHGSVVNNGNGTFGYNPNGAFEYLAAGETTTDTLTYTVTDNNGASSTQTATVTITGQNDAVMVASADRAESASLTERSATTGSAAPDAQAGTIHFTDVDLSDRPTATVSAQTTSWLAADGHTALTLTGAQASALAAAFAIHAEAGNTDNGAIDWNYSIADSALDFLAQGETATVTSTVLVDDHHGGTDTATVTVTITGTNDAPVITGGATTGSVTEDAAVTQATGQFTVADPDHGAQQIWTVVGGTPSGNANYHFRADSFTVTGNIPGGTFVDNFDDGVPPPSLPASEAANYGTTYAGVGNFGEAGGKLLLDSNTAGSFVGVGTPDPIIGQDALLKTSLNPANTTQGLRMATTFQVNGVFDLVLPDSPREEYGIRLMDRLIGGPGTPPDQQGDDTIALTVREGINGSLVVGLRRIDFADNITTNLQSIALNPPPGADQIHLRFDHAAGAQTVTASFDYLQGGVVVGSQTFSTTPAIFHGEDWTRADIVADAPATNDSALGGSYGTLDISQAGAWTYSLDNSRASTQSLAQGQHATDTFTVQVADQFGATDSRVINVDVVGTNDTPIMQTAAVSRTLVEDSTTPNLTASGLAQFSDVDLTDTHTTSAVLQSTALSGGGSLPPGLAAQLAAAITASLTDPSTGDGHGGIPWNFALDDNAVQFLAAGQTLTLVYNVTATDPFGASATQAVTVTIVGTNDTPMVEAILANGDSAGTATPLPETNSGLTANGTVTVTDVDVLDVVTATTPSVAATGNTNGMSNATLESFFSVSPAAPGAVIDSSHTTGSLSWAFNSGSQAFDYLAQGEVLTLQYTIRATDSSGAANNTGDGIVTIRIVGTNDAPVAQAITGAANEDGPATTLSASYTDADLSDSHTFAVDTAGTHGTVANNGNGTFGYNPNGAFESLAAGETTTDTFTYTVTDNNGASSTQTATVTITGQNDAPAAQAITGAANEDGPATTLSASYSDVDTSDTHTFAVNTAGTHGSVVNNGGGTFGYNPNGAFEYLAAGETTTDTFTYTVTDNNGASSTQTATVTITGQNDAVMVASADRAESASLTERSATTGSAAPDGQAGTIHFTDVDLSDRPTATVSAQTTSWLAADGHTALTLTGSQASALAAAFAIHAEAGNTNNGAVDWNYSIADSALDFLAQGETATVTSTVLVDDHHGGTDTATVTVTIIGTNDAPVITGGATTGSVTEDAAVTQATGQFTVADPDHGAQQIWTVVGGTPSGSADYHFRADSFKVTGNIPGGTYLDDFSDNVPPPSLPASEAANYGTTYGGIGNFGEAGGKLLLDSNNAVSFVGVGTPDPFIGQDAVLKTNINPAATTSGLKMATAFGVDGVFDLVLPDSPREEYGIRMTDRLIGGPGTPPDQAGDDVIELVVREGITGNLVVALRRVDFVNDVTTNLQSIALSPPAGADQIHLRFDHTANAQTLTASFDYLQGGVVVGSQTFSTTPAIFHGENWTRAEIVADAPATNDSALGGSYGTLDITQAGAWTYSLDNSRASTQSLAQGQHATDTFTVQVADQFGATDSRVINVDVVGTNDTPIMQTAAVSRTLVEDSTTPNLTASGLAQFSDVDLTDTHTTSAVLQSTALSGGGSLPPGLAAQLAAAITASLTDPSTGDGHGGIQWNFALDDNAVQFLAAGQTLTLVYNVTATDPFGASATQAVTVTIVGTNDTPVVEAILANGDSAGTATPLPETNSGLTANGTVTVTDVDVLDVVTATTPSVAATGNTNGMSNATLESFFSVSPAAPGAVIDSSHTTGSLSWAFNSGSQAFDYLAQGEVLTLQYTIRATDSSSAANNTGDGVVTIRIVGTNDAPVLNADMSGPLAIVEQAGVTGSATPDQAAATWSFTDADLSDTHIATIDGPQHSLSSNFDTTTAIGHNQAGALDQELASELAHDAHATVTHDSTGSGAGQVEIDVSAPDSILDKLAAGETETLVYSLTVEDNHGVQSNSQPVTITFAGTNDGPVLAADPVTSHAVSEQTGVTGSASLDTASAELSFTDVDYSDTHTVSVGAPAVTWSGGLVVPAATLTALQSAVTLIETSDSTFANTGSVVANFRVADNLVDFLAAGETLTATYNVTVDDGHGGNSTQPVTFTVTGTNDAPVAHATDGSTNEDGPAITLPMGYTDVDANDTHTLTVHSGGAQGQVIDNGNGTFTYDPNGQFEHLAAGETATDIVGYTVTDNHGASSDATANITITGQNDAPVAQAGTLSVVAGGPVTDPIAFNYSDVDTDDTHTFAIDTTGTHGVVFNMHNGTFAYGAPPAAFAYLAQGETATDTFNYTVTDNHGASSTQTVTVTVIGVNDAPVAAAITGAANEDGPATVLSASYTDADLSDTHSYSVNTAGTHGAVIANSNGTFTYNPNGAFEYLAQGETATDTFHYTVTDNHGAFSTQTATVTITGQNDAPTLAVGTSIGEIAEIADNAPGENTATVTTSGSVGFFDVDLSDSHTVTVLGNGTPNYVGALSAQIVPDSTGSGSGQVAWTFNVNDGALDSLSQGDQLLQEYSLRVVDSHSAQSIILQVEVFIDGTNDAPIAVSINGNVAADGTTTLAASYTDVDQHDTHTFAVDTTDTQGIVTDNGNGTFGYDPHGAFADLAVGETATDTFQYTVTDNHGGSSTQTATVTINGDNAPPVITSGPSTGQVTERSDQNTFNDLANGNLSFTDANLNDSHTVSVTGNGTSGYLGTLSAFIVEGTGSGHGNVHWTFVVADGALDHLAEGETLTQTYAVQVFDHHTGASNTQSVTIAINGSNDAPVVAAIAGAANEDGPATTLTASYTDDDTSDTHTYDVDATGTLGLVTSNGDGTFSYDPNGQFESLGAGATTTDTFQYTVSDNHDGSSTNTATVTITGQNDAPVAVADTASATETGGAANDTIGINPSGNVLNNDTDVDVGDTKSVLPGSFTGAHGGLLLMTNGHYDYGVNNADPAVDALRLSTDTLTDTFNYTVFDAAGAASTSTLTITIHGANDNPVAVADVASATEAGGVANGNPGVNPTGNVLTNDTDVDAGDTKTVTTLGPLPGAHGTLALAADGTYTYTVNNADASVQALRLSTDTLTDTFNYTVTDTAGATSSSTLTVTIHGANDAPVAVADTASATETGGAANDTIGINPSGNVLNNDTDVDAGDSKSVLPGSFTGAHGGLLLMTNGHYDYGVNNADPAVDALRLSTDTLTDTFNYTVFDAAGAASTSTLTITIHGANDNPVAVADVASATEAGGVANGNPGVNPTGNVLTNDTDVDAGDTKTVTTLGPLPGSHGTLALAADGTYTYTVNNADASVQALRLSTDTLTDTFNYTVTDTAGATSSSTLTVTIHGANDAPVAVADTASATETGGAANDTIGINPSGNVLNNDTDVDAGDSKSVLPGSFTGAHGELLLMTNGNYDYAVNNADPAVDALRLSTDTLTDTFNYTVFDAAGATSTSTLTITIHGANDNPVAVADTASATEAGGVANGTPGVNPTGNVLTNDTDVDAGDSKVITTLGPMTGAHGTLALAANGAYTYTVNNADSAVDALTSAQTLTDTFNYTMRDGAGATSSSTLTVTIHGANDAPVAVADTASATEAGGVNNGTPGVDPTGNVLTNDTDVDAGDSKAVTTLGPMTGAHGTLALAADGAYTYTVNNANSAVDALTSAQTLTDTFNYMMRDGSGATSSSTLTVTIHGANDAPVAVADTASATETGGVNNGSPGVNPTGNVLTNDTDVDAGDSKVVTTLGPMIGAHGTLALAANGAYTYTVNNADSAVDALRLSTDVLTDTFNYTMRDGAGATSGSTLTVTIHGANDAPVAVSDAASATEAGGLANATPGVNPTGNVLTNDTDVDSGDTKTIVSVSPVSTVNGSLAMAADGSYTYTVNNASSAVQALRLSTDTIVDTFNYTMQDSAGATSSSTLTVTIHGANDAPVAVADTASATEAGELANATPGVNPTGNVLTNDTDVDAGDSKIVSTTGNLVGAHGTLSLAADGSYTYTVDNGDAAVQALRLSTDTLTDTINYTMHDTAGATSASTITVTIHGANDNPVAVADTASATEAGGIANGTAGVNPTGNVLTNDTDVDAGDSKTVTTPGTFGGAHGSLVLAADGSYTYTVNNNDVAVQALRQSTDQLTDTFNYTMKDTAGATSASTLTVTIHGADDNPVAVADTNGADTVSESGVGPGNTVFAGDPIASGNVLTNDTDVDSVANGETKAMTTLGTVVGTYGSALFNADGSWTYTLDNNDADTQALALGTTAHDVFNYTMHDAAGLTSSSTLDISIAGTNDAPVVANAIADQSVGIFTNVSFVLPANAFHDVDTGDTLTYAVGTLPSWMSYNSTSHTFSGFTQGTNIGTSAITVTATDSHGASVSDSFNFSVVDGPGTATGTAVVDTFTGGSFADTITGGGGSDVLVGGGGDDVIFGDGQGQGSPSLTATAAGYLSAGNSLINGLGGTVGFGDTSTFNADPQAVPAGIRTDDGSTSAINIDPVFSSGLNFFGTTYHSIYINNNGDITFSAPNAAYIGTAITGAVGNPIIAPFWDDVDTRFATGQTVGVTSPGGNSHGTDLVYQSLDVANHVLTITWDDVGHYQQVENATNNDAFQLQLIDEGGGDFDIVFRYENINWDTGSASGGAVARAGYTAADGNPAHYFETAGSGTSANLNWDTTPGNLGTVGVDVFQVRGGVVVDNNDRIVGGAGNDTLTGGPGNDTFVYNAPTEGVDTITDFQSGTDRLEISAAGFGHGLVANTAPALVTAADLATATHAGTNGYFIFDNSGANSGTVYWDATGGSGADATAIAHLTGVTAITSSDFHIV